MAGNVFVAPLRTVVVDNTAPSLTVSVDTTINIASPDPETLGATATDTGTGIDYVKFEQCNSPGATCGVADWTTLTIDTTLPYSVAWPIPTDGIRLLAVTAVDNAGRQAYETVPVTIDRTAPTTALTAPVAAANLRGTAPVAASASDPAPGGVQLVEFQLTTNGGAYTNPSFASDSSSPYTGSLDTTGYADGLYDLRTFTSDVSGNSTASSGVTVRIDNTLPTGSVTAPTAGANIRGTTVALTSDSADAGSGVATVQFQRSPAGAGTWTNQGATFDTTAVADGLYDLRVVTTDNAGNSFTSGCHHRARRQHAPDRLGHEPGRGRGRSRLDHARERLGRCRLGCRDCAVPALPGRRGHVDEPGRELEHDPAGRRSVRHPRRDDRQRRQRLHLPDDHDPRRQHGPDRLDHGSARRRRGRRGAGQPHERLGRRGRLRRPDGRLRAQSCEREHLDGDGGELEHGDRA